MELEIISYLRAGFSTFWIKTTEPGRVRKNVYDKIRSFKRKDGNKYEILEWTCTAEPNPLKALEQLNQAEDCALLFAYNFHWYADKPQIIQTIQDSLASWSNTGKALICVSPVEKIPLELQKEFLLLTLPLPNRAEILDIVTHISSNTNSVPVGKQLEKLVSSCKGLTRVELEQVLALSFVKTEGKYFSRDVINNYKAITIRKTGFLDVLLPNINFSNIIGYENIKKFVLETIDNPKAKGIMTIGPPGCGKTALMKAIVGQTGKFGLSVNMGRLFSKYQGETDRNINATIDLITAIGDCLVLIDEKLSI